MIQKQHHKFMKPTEEQLLPIFLSICMRMASEEGITDEQDSVKRAHQIIDDAKLEEPVTSEGKLARTKALEIFSVRATNDPQVVKFNYDKFRDEHSIVAVCAILKKIGEHSDFLAIPSKASPEYQKAAEEAYEKLILDSFKALNENQVGMSEFKYIFDSLKAVISALEESVMQQVVGHRHEIMSRLFGVKNPGTEKFDSNYATYETLVTTLEKIRKDTGGKMDDYFTINPSE